MRPWMKVTLIVVAVVLLLLTVGLFAPWQDSEVSTTTFG